MIHHHSFSVVYGMCDRPTLAVILLLAQATGVSQVVTDTSFGPSVTVPNTGGPEAAVYDIGPETGKAAGSNLFHSFRSLNLPPASIANFHLAGISGISNIIARVTGGAPSAINGVLYCEEPNVNLFLINPSGLIFGQGSSINVRGSFVASTADSVIFADRTVWPTGSQDQSALTAAAPEAFGFLKPESSSIRVESELSVGSGHTLSLIAGDVQLGRTSSYTLRADGGTVYLGSSGGAGTVPLDPALAQPSATGEIRLAEGAYVAARSFESQRGTIFIRGGRFIMEAGSKIDVTNDTNGQGGAVDIHAGALVRLEHGEGTIDATTRGTGDGANVRIVSGGTIELQNAQIAAGAASSGNAGAIELEARNGISLNGGRGIAVNNEEGSSGNLGGVSLTSGGTVEFSGGARVWVENKGSGAPATVQVNARDLVLTGAGSGIYNVAPEQSRASTGAVRVNAQTVDIRRGARISTDAESDGATGRIDINASKSVVLTDYEDEETGLFTWAIGQGDAGGARIQAPSVLVGKGAKISSRAVGRGNGGNIAIVTDELVLEGRPQGERDNKPTEISSFVTDGTGGLISVAASRSVSLTGTAVAGRTFGVGGGLPVDPPDGIYSDTVGQGVAGGVSISTASLNVRGGALVRSGSGDNSLQLVAQRAPGPVTGRAGDIAIQARDITVEGGSRIEALTVTDGTGGAVRIHTGSLDIRGAGRLADGSLTPSGIFSDAHGNGSAGSIDLEVESMRMNGGAVQVTSRQAGDAGAITVSAGEMTLTAGARIDSSTFAGGRGGRVEITAGTAAASGAGAFGASGVFSIATGAGDAGTITLRARDLTVGDGARIDSSTSGNGNGGAITLTGSNSIVLTGGLFTASTGSGNSGAVAIDAADLRIQGGGRIDTSTSGTGKGGAVAIDARNLLEISGPGSGIFSFSNGPGDAGGLGATAAQLAVRDGARIDSSALHRGSGGNVQLTARESLLLSGSASGIFSVSNGTGRAGTIVLQSPDVAITGGARIDSSALSTGQGGQIRVRDADSIRISGSGASGASGIFSSTRAQGIAGVISLSGRLVDISDRAVVSASSEGAGDAGQISITAGESLTIRNAVVTTSSVTAFGGSIFLDSAMRAIGRLRIVDSIISTSVTGGIAPDTGAETRTDAGSIFIGRGAAFASIVLERSQVRANATAGTGGFIDLNAPLLLRSESIVSASAGPEGISGRVNIESPVSQLSENFTPLRITFLPELQLEDCARSAGSSTFSTGLSGGVSTPYLTWRSLLRMDYVPALKPLPCVAEALSK